MESIITEFSDIESFMDYITDDNRVRGWKTRSSQRLEEKNGCFFRTENFGEALNLAKNGWKEGLEKITQRLPLLLSIGRSKTRINDVAGDLPDIGRFIAGNPDSMTRRVINMGMKRPVIDLLYNGTFAARIEPDTIINYGAAVAVVIDELENSGFTVGLKICSASQNSGVRLSPLVTLKKPGEVTELDRLIFFTAHPSFLRRLVFSYKESTITQSQCGSSYGSCVELWEVPSDTVYFSNEGDLNRSCATPELAIQHVKSIVRKSRPDLFSESEAA